MVGDRYELGPVIGVGSSAEVRRGRDLRRGIRVAVKIFHPGARRRQDEIDALAQLHHPGLVGLHDSGVTDGRAFVVTDLVEGPTLADRITEGPLSAGAVRRIGAQLASALAHVHATGFVHRDLKPANVLLGDDGRARLADFGIARALDATASTTAGCVLGTAAYLAPEQALGEVVGPPADVYALGLVLLESLTGRREYPGTAVESATARLFRAPTVPDELPGGMTELLVAMTAAAPDERPTASEVAALLAGEAHPSSRRRGAHRLRRPLRGRVRALIAAAVLVLTGLAGVLALEEAGPPAAAPGAHGTR